MAPISPSCMIPSTNSETIWRNLILPFTIPVQFKDASDIRVTQLIIIYFTPFYGRFISNVAGLYPSSARERNNSNLGRIPPALQKIFKKSIDTIQYPSRISTVYCQTIIIYTDYKFIISGFF